MAFAITCLERVCTAWEIKSEPMDRLLGALWKFVSSKDLGEWLEEILPRALPVSDFTPSECASEFAYSHCSYEQKQIMCCLIEEVISVGEGNIYGGYRSEYTLEPTLFVAELLKRYAIELPDLSPFAKSHVSEEGGWGKSVEPGFFRG